MDLPTAQTWFRSLEPRAKIAALVDIMFQSTLTVRGISAYLPNDCETRWRLALHISEMNHSFASAASAMMDGEDTYPGDVLMEILLDQSSHPELQEPCRQALVAVVQRHGGAARR